MKKIKESKFVIGFVKVTGALPALLFFKPKVYYSKANTKKQKLSRPSILVSNHTSLMDFALYLLVFFNVNIRFLMAEVLFGKNKLFSWFLYKLGAIFVNRDNFDFGFMGEALESLDKGRVIGIFPQGRLPVGDKVFPFKPSMAFIALHTDAPVIPVYTDGNYSLFKRARIIIGEEMYIKDICPKGMSDKEAVDFFTKETQKRVYELKDELTAITENKNER